MRWRALFFLSLGVNVALGATWLFWIRPRHDRLPGATAAETGAALIRTNVVVRRQYFSWREVESPDYPTYIANLRAIDCPEQTIRDIIIADVNALYARRRATEVTTPEQQWWRSEPDPALARAAAAKLLALEQERRALLARLLGPDWESRDLANLPRPSHPGVALDGQVLGVLPTDVKQAVQDVSARAQQRLQAYLDAQRQLGKTPDPAELARLRQQTRDELTNVLTPPQLEEYLLRYSQNANSLRAELGQLKYFDATPDEFRAMFRAVDPIDQQLDLLAGANDPNSVAQRDSLLQQRDAALKLALDPERYREYQLLHDPTYRAAYVASQQAGDPGAVDTLYQISLATAQEQAAIRADTNLTPEQMALQLKSAEVQQLKANLEALGQAAPPDQSAPQTNPPPPALPPPSTHPYVLGAGETASTVARIFGVSIDAIRAANPGVNLNRLRPGDAIRVPDSLPGP
jgi:LysM repeat protein